MSYPVIDVARVFSGDYDLFSRSPQYTGSAKINHPHLQLSPVSRPAKNLTSSSSWGALTTYPYKLRPPHFYPSAPPCYAYASPWRLETYRVVSESEKELAV